MMDFVGFDLIVDKALSAEAIRGALAKVFSLPTHRISIIEDVANYPERDAAEIVCVVSPIAGEFAAILSIQSDPMSVAGDAPVDVARHLAAALGTKCLLPQEGVNPYLQRPPSPRRGRGSGRGLTVRSATECQPSCTILQQTLRNSSSANWPCCSDLKYRRRKSVGIRWFAADGQGQLLAKPPRVAESHREGPKVPWGGRVMRMNRRFVARWEAERLSEVLPKIELHPRLLRLVRAPFVRRAGGLLLEPLVADATGPESFQDATGYEAFVNKFHVDDFIDEAGASDTERLRILIQQGTKAAIELAERLKKEGSFRVLLSLDADLPTMTLRFFGRREGEHWGANDPDAFQLEEVLLIDTTQTPAS